MERIDFELKEEYIELIKLLKLVRIAESGGQAKLFVENGEVKLNGKTESRKRAKLRGGDIVEIFDIQIFIK
jgi:ribosome-associated protein